MELDDTKQERGALRHDKDAMVDEIEAVRTWFLHMWPTLQVEAPDIPELMPSSTP